MGSNSSRFCGPVNGGVAMVHSRKLKGQTVVSTQSFVVNNSYLASYQTAAAFNSAVKSYGIDVNP